MVDPNFLSCFLPMKKKYHPIVVLLFDRSTPEPLARLSRGGCFMNVRCFQRSIWFHMNPHQGYWLHDRQFKVSHLHNTLDP